MKVRCPKCTSPDVVSIKQQAEQIRCPKCGHWYRVRPAVGRKIKSSVSERSQPATTIHCLCKKTFHVPAIFAGKRITCANCGRPHRVPNGKEPPVVGNEESYGLAPADQESTDSTAEPLSSSIEFGNEDDQDVEGSESDDTNEASPQRIAKGSDSDDVPGGMWGVVVFFGAPIFGAFVISLIAEGFRSFALSFDDGCEGPFGDLKTGHYWLAFSESKVWLKMFLWIWRVLAPFGALSCFLAGLKDMRVEPPAEPTATRLVGGGVLFVLALPLWAWFPSSKTDVWALTPTGFQTSTGEIPWKDIKLIELQNRIDGEEKYHGPAKSFEGDKDFKVVITMQSGEVQTYVPPLGMRTYEYRPPGEASLRWGRLEAADRNESLWKYNVETYAPHAELKVQIEQRLKFQFGKSDNKTETRLLVSPINK
jgi:hypothetical protein